MGDPGSPTPRAAPFYCPYCGEEDFVPYGEPGAYLCNSCTRHWSLRFLGIAAAPGDSAATAER